MSVSRNLVAALAGNGWAALMGLAFIPVYVSHLGIEGYGLIGFLATLQAWSLVLDLGLGTALNREIARQGAGASLAQAAQALRDLLRSAEAVYGLLAALVALLIAALSGAIALHWLQAQTLPPAAVAQAVSLMGLVLATQMPAALYRNAILGLQRQVWLAGATAAMATLRAGGAAAVLVWVAPSLSAFLVFFAVVGAAESILLRWYLHRHLPRTAAGPVRLQPLRAVWPFASGVAATMFLGTLLTQLDKLLLARLLPLDEFGYFMLAVTVSGALAVLIVPVSSVAYPKLSELVAARDEEAVASQYHRFAQLLSIGLFPPAVLLGLFAQPLLLLWTNDAATARAAAPVLSVWVAGTALNGLMHLPYAAQLAHGWARLSALLNTVAVLLVTPAVLLLAPRYGAMAAAWIWVAVNAGYLVFGVGLMHRRILPGEKWEWYLRDLLAPLAGCGAAAWIALKAYSSLEPLSRASQLAFFAAALLLLAAAAASCSSLAWQALLERLPRADRRAAFRRAPPGGNHTDAGRRRTR